ncbi:hypothetical protein [Alicyclobacillus fastidiosus]|uniref:XRE family transcriptional regulator n=1 Tax=Alicyclobacillus fastidiosus TaxID=392011 RepID=A0ABV5AL00_9BACL
MISPVREALNESGLSASQFATICGVHVTGIHIALRGDSSKLSDRILNGLERLGYSRDVMSELYAKYREERKEAVMAQLIS